MIHSFLKVGASICIPKERGFLTVAVTSAFKHMTESDVQSALTKQVSRPASSILRDSLRASTVAEKVKKTMPQKSCVDAGALQAAAQPFVQIICLATYQISNNLLSDDQTDNFLQWIIDHGSMQFLRQLTHVNNAVTKVLKANLLLSAIRLRNAKTVQLLLNNGTSPSIFNPITQDTALQLAVSDELGNAEIVRLLLKYGACPNTTYPESTERYPPLCLAMMDLPQKSSIAEMLILAGADVNVSYKDIKPPWIQKTPLITAAAQEDASLTKILLKKGANPDVFHLGSRSALHAAVQNNRVGSIRALLDAGANANIPYGEENQLHFDHGFGCFSRDSPYYASDSLLTPIDIAYENENGQVVDLLLQAKAHAGGYLAFETNWDQNLSRLALQDAARRGKRYLVQVLLMAGVDINTSPSNFDVQTALQAAAESGDIDMVQLLLDMGAVVNAPPHTIGGLTALQAAIYYENLDIVELLIRQGGEINAKPAPLGGQTCLGAAVSTGNVDLVNMLLSRGADINPARSGPGKSFLFF